MPCPYIFGIDYGTTVSTISVLTLSTGNIEPICDIPSKLTIYQDSHVIGVADTTAKDATIAISPKNNLEGSIEYTQLIIRYLYQQIHKFAIDKDAIQSKYDIILCVPVIYNHRDRTLLRRVCEDEKLNIVRFISEPTAAFLGYSSDKTLESGNRHSKSSISDEIAMIYDLGGGTLDVSLIEMDENGCEVIWSDGNRNFGSEDLTHTLMKDFNVAKSVASSWKESTDLSLKYRSQGSNTWLKTAVSYLSQAICDISEHRNIKVAKVIFTGGGTLYQPFINATQEYCKKKGICPSYQHNVMYMKYIISRGACAYARTFKCKRAGTDDENGYQLVVIDVLPLTLGVKVGSEQMFPIFKRNSNIPCTSSHTFTTFEDRQSNMTIDIFQGERGIANKNYHLGQVVIPFTTYQAKGVPRIDVEFKILVNAMIEVTATNRETKETFSLVAGSVKDETLITDNRRISTEHASMDEKLLRTIILREEIKTLLELEISKLKFIPNPNEAQDSLLSKYETMIDNLGDSDTEELVEIKQTILRAVDLSVPCTDTSSELVNDIPDTNTLSSLAVGNDTMSSVECARFDEQGSEHSVDNPDKYQFPLHTGLYANSDLENNAFETKEYEQYLDIVTNQSEYKFILNELDQEMDIKCQLDYMVGAINDYERDKNEFINMTNELRTHIDDLGLTTYARDELEHKINSLLAAPDKYIERINQLNTFCASIAS